MYLCFKIASTINLEAHLDCTFDYIFTFNLSEIDKQIDTC